VHPYGNIDFKNSTFELRRHPKPMSDEELQVLQKKIFIFNYEYRL